MNAKRNALAVLVQGALPQPNLKVPEGLNEAQLGGWKKGVNAATDIAGLMHNANLTAVNLFTIVAEIETREEADSFVDGFKAYGKTLSENKDKAIANAGDRTLELVSKMNRIIRSVHGFTKNVTVNGKQKKKDVKGIGVDKVLEILAGPGTVTAKLEKLPSFDTSRRKTPGEDPVQVRIKAASNSVPSMDSMAQVLGATAKKAIDLPKVAMSVLLSGIKQCPDTNLGEVVNATLNRCFASSDETMKEWAINARDHLQKLGITAKTRTLIDGATGKPVQQGERTKAKGEVAQPQPK